MADAERTYFTPNSTDELISNSLEDGDVVLINKRCSSMANASPWRAALCMAAKYGLSGDGRSAWDHAAVVHRKDGVPYLLEGDARGVTLRTFEERLLQGSDHQEITVLPLRGTDGDQTRKAMSSFVKELNLRKTLDGFDGDGATSCDNTWAVYRQLCAKPRRDVGEAVVASSSNGSAPCRFGAPLVATALQRLGVVDEKTDAASVTPKILPMVPLKSPAFLDRPRSVRTL